MPTEYENAHKKYRDLVKASANGDAAARADKVKAMNEIRNIEREAARAGTILSAEYKGDKIITSQKQTHSKKDLQSEYVRKFDDEAIVLLPDKAGEKPKEQTLQEFHRKRLLGR